MIGGIARRFAPPGGWPPGHRLRRPADTHRGAVCFVFSG